MRAGLGWAAAVLAVAFGSVRYGWQGAIAAVTVVVFATLVQFNRALKVMRRAADAPIGHADSAVMLASRLQPGMRLVDVVRLTRSLGQRLDAGDDRHLERWRWADSGGAAVELVLRAGRLAEWRLVRPGDGSPVESQSP
jgi:hypothetical protein